MSQNNGKDWSAIGIDWERITVEKDDTLIGHVWSPRAMPTGIDAMVKHFGPSRVSAWLNGSGTFDVRARSWFKSRWSKNRDNVRMDDDAMKDAVAQTVLYNARGRTVTTVRQIAVGVFSMTLNAGQEYVYADIFTTALEANLRAMPDAPPQAIRQMVAKSLETAGIVPDADEDENDEE